jgi:DNA polymerase III gamma/tau subunit
MTAGLYNKYRPKSLKDYLGNEKAVASIKKLAKNPPTALLISGATGLGKTTLCRIFASMVLEAKDVVSSQSYIEKNIGAERGIAGVRELLDTLEYKPYNKNNKRIIVLDEIHKQTPDGFSALYKPLEEPPSGNTWVLITNHPELLPREILNRCAKVQLHPLSDNNIRDLIKSIITKEKIPLSKQSIKDIVKHANGEPREAISSLESISFYKNPNESLVKKELAKQTPIDITASFMLYCLYTRDSKKFLKTVFSIRSDLDKVVDSLLSINRLILHKLSGTEVDHKQVNKVVADIKVGIDAVIKTHLTLKSIKVMFSNDPEILLQLYLKH